MAELKIFLDKALIFLYNIFINNQKLSIFLKGNDMDLTYLQYTDAELVELAEQKQHTREANREITRRKMVGSWRLLASWQPEKEVSEERVYAEGVVRRT
tara:strand:+ start:375 stop:671 length:297 start_codon:yes stop_codon:yes gene_type:complete